MVEEERGGRREDEVSIKEWPDGKGITFSFNSPGGPHPPAGLEHLRQVRFGVDGKGNEILEAEVTFDERRRARNKSRRDPTPEELVHLVEFASSIMPGSPYTKKLGHAALERMKAEALKITAARDRILDAMGLNFHSSPKEP